MSNPIRNDFNAAIGAHVQRFLESGNVESVQIFPDDFMGRSAFHREGSIHYTFKGGGQLHVGVIQRQDGDDVETHT